MKFLAAFASLFLLMLVPAQGADEITSILGSGGKPDMQKVQQFIDWVEPAIVEYPTHFKDEATKKSITEATAKVCGEIMSLPVEKMDDVKQLTLLGYILSMGHNADLNTSVAAHRFFQRALTLDHDNVRANYLYGMFLVGTDKYHFDSLPYLQKALTLGEREAQFPIAMLYYQKGDKAKAIQQMEDYAKARPKEPQIWDVIAKMKANDLEFSKQGPPGPIKGAK